MLKVWAAVPGAALILLLAAASARAADPAPWGSIENRLVASFSAGPAGWQELCRRDAWLCDVADGPRMVRLTRAAYTALAAVQASVNAAIELGPEPAGVDHWLVAPAVGDCDDYAVTKRVRLLEQGWPPSILRFALAVTESGEPHLVLLIETDKGTVVLDNRFEQPARWTELDRLGYRWLAVEQPHGALRWQLTADGLDVARFGVLPSRPPVVAMREQTVR